jgi:uncharacterized protein (DUF924 family)|tara:strand:- start:2247 stop:2807 length:561 start_codon:yes stop_codon:yes gene_type:complete
MHKKAHEILDFWFKETPSKKRFQKHKDFDQKIKDKFLKDYKLASENEYDDWQDSSSGSLALVILFDQFSRNMFRNDKKAFEQDHKTRLIVNDSVYSGFLEEMDQDQKFFMILPLIHSEEITDHDMAYYLLDKYLKDHPGLNEIKKFWKNHTFAIKKFHRYPHRNKILGRVSTPKEIDFLNSPNSSW